MIKHTIFLGKVISLATARFFREKYTLYVSALTFTTLLAIVPLLAVSVFCLTIFPSFSKFIIIAEKYIFNNLVPTSAAAIQIYFQRFIEQALHLPVFSIVLLFFTAIMMFNTIDETINTIWKITIKRKKIFLYTIYSIILLIAPFLLGLSIFSTSYIISTYLYLGGINSFLFLILPIFINTVILSLFYIYAPNTTVKKLDGFIAGTIAAILIEIARVLFAVWISYFSTYELIYGVFSILPIFLLWLYICWFIILWGVMVTYTLATHEEKV